MKHTLTLCALMFAASASAQFTGDRLHKMILNTSELSTIYDTQLHINDIDSIIFDVEYQNLLVFGINRSQAHYNLELLRGFDFTYLSEGEMPSTCFTNAGYDINPARNIINPKWRKVDGASGYQIRYTSYPQSEDFDWNDNSCVEGELTVDGEATEAHIAHLRYDKAYQLAIRTLSPKGDGYHSEWSTRCRFSSFPATYYTDSRYITPSIIKAHGTGNDEITITMNTEFNPSHYSEANADTIRSRFEIVNNHFVVNKIRITNMSTNETRDYSITDADIKAGQVIFTGLDQGTLYNFSIYNTNIPWECDAIYHSSSTWTLHDTLIPIFVTSTDLSEVLLNYMSDNSHPSGQVYYLEGGKTYTISSGVSLYKGMTIATNPADIAEGKRAKVEFSPGTPCNFFLGRTSQSGVEYETIYIDPIVFDGIDFSAPEANNFGSGLGTGNYFINNFSIGIPYNLESLEIKNCTFQKFIRGFVRMQGNGHNIAKINVDNNVFYNCGYYDIHGRGYAWFNGAGSPNSNLFGDLNFTNNTIYDSPRRALIYDENKSLAWPEDVKWNIRIENNTFINFSTRISCYIFATRYMPAGSYISLQRNLFVLAADEADQRALYSSGADIRSTDFSFDVKDNYSVGCRDSHLRNDGIFTAGAFSASRHSFSNGTNNGTREDLIVKVGSTPLKATDLFTNPNPPYTAHDPATPNELDHAAPENIFEALRYRQTTEVLSHEIYTLSIGDPRWRN